MCVGGLVTGHVVLVGNLQNQVRDFSGGLNRRKLAIRV